MAIRILSGAKHRPSPRGGRKENGLPRRLSAPRNDVVNLAGPSDLGGWSSHMAGGSMPRPYRMHAGVSPARGTVENPLDLW